jgi:hypothetical protein
MARSVEEGLQEAIEKVIDDGGPLGLAQFYWVFVDGRVEKCSNTACSAGLSMWNKPPANIKYVVSGRRYRNQAKEASVYGIKYMDWLIHRSPYSHFTLDNDPSVAWNKGYLVYDAELADGNLLVSATVAHRMAWEFGGQIMYTWAKLVEYGMEETAAFLPAHMMNIGERCNGLSIHGVGYGYGAHQCINPEGFDAVHIANWNNHTPRKELLLGKAYSLYPKYAKICHLWGEFSAEYGQPKAPLFKEINKYLSKAYDSTVKKDRVPKRKVNPFRSVEADGGDEHAINLDDFLPNVIEYLKEKFHAKSVH